MSAAVDASLVRPSNYADDSKTTFYVLVRTDISVEQQLVQAVHAAAEVGRSFYDPEHGIASAVVLAVPDKQALLEAHTRLGAKGVRTELFFEPDFDMEHSALATEPLEPHLRKYLRGYPLWRASAKTPVTNPSVFKETAQ